MYLMKRRKTQSGFVHNGLSDNGGSGTGSPWAAIATIVATAGPLVFGGGGDSAADLRKRKRESLASLGFRWDWTKGYQQGDYDNIDGWDDTSLDNIADAYNKYGQIVAELHNQGVFNQANTQSPAQIEQIIQQNGGGNTGGTFFNAWGNQGNVTGAGMDYTPWIMGAVGLAGIAVLANVMKQGNAKKKSK